MPAPSDISTIAGKAVVYRALLTSDQYVEDPNWRVASVSESVLGRPASASIEFNRAQLISGEPVTIPEPVIGYDSRFKIAFRVQGQAGGTVLFEGTPANIPRQESGTVGAKSSVGVLNLVAATEMWTRGEDRVINGSRYAKVVKDDEESDENTIVRDSGVPCVFNPGGRPNRSYSTTEDAGFFDDADMAHVKGPAHYFVDGWDVTRQSNELKRRRARYWTFADAIAYLLWFEAGSNSGNPDGEIPGLVDFRVSFGEPPAEDAASDDSDFLWRVIESHIGIQPYGELYEAGGITQPTPFPDPTQFVTSAAELLTARVPGISVEGMPVLHAIDKLVTAAGLRAWVDCKKQFANINSPPTIVHKIKVTTPGGELNSGGFGSVFIPKLDPYRSRPAEGESAADIFARNNIQQVNVAYDFTGTVTKPKIVRGPTRYEITVQLRPGWEPIHPEQPEHGFAYIDNVDPNGTIQDPGNTVPVNQADAARAEALYACLNGRVDFDRFLMGTTSPPHMIRRVKWMVNSLITGGAQAEQYHDVLRKWILPTNHRYPTEKFKRDTMGINEIPKSWGFYKPINFETGKSDDSEVDSVLVTPLTSEYVESELPDTLKTGKGASVWPQRARPFLPCLVRNRNLASPGVIVEISFDRGENWYVYPSVRLAQDESAIWLNFQNPLLVTNPKAVQADAEHKWKRANLFTAYISHSFRVRITCSIEGSDDVGAIPSTPVSPHETSVVQVFDRRDRYIREVIASKHEGKTVTDVEDIPEITDPDSNDSTSGLLKDSTKVYFWRPARPRPQMIRDADRVRVWRTGRKVAGTLTIPWIETDASPGSVVPRIDGRAAGAGEADINLEFEDVTVSGDSIAPIIVGVVYNFGNQYSTALQLEEWRGNDRNS